MPYSNSWIHPVCISITLRLVVDSGAGDLDFVYRPVLRASLHEPHPLDHPHSTLDSPEYRMLAVEPRCWRERDEELASVCIWPAVGHAQDSRTCVLQRRADLVFELLPVDGASSPPCTGRVACLNHEVGDDAMDYNVVVVASLG